MKAETPLRQKCCGLNPQVPGAASPGLAGQQLLPAGSHSGGSVSTVFLHPGVSC